MNSIQDHRTFYANLVVGTAGSTSENLITAFATVEREHYVGPGPWSVVAGQRYLRTVSDDPRLLYQDIVIGLAPERHINNGQPTLHARCLIACAPAAGDAVVHVGTGTGYYTAILASLVGAAGTITGYEIEADLAARARDNLQHLPNVRIENASACAVALPEADVIYVNAGATRPAAGWLDALKDCGRLIFPLTSNNGFGVMLLLTRRGRESYAAKVISPAAFIGCVGARNDAESHSVGNAMQTRSILSAKSLRRGTAPDATVCCAGNGWWLSSEEVA